jgi:CheY-like chemotaxis protein
LSAVSDLLDLRREQGRLRQPLSRVLVVHPDPLTRSLLNEVLRDFPASVEICEEGAAALRLLARRRFDLVITSEWLPGMNARAIVDACLKDDDPTPVIVLDTDGPCGEVHIGGRHAPARVSCPFSPAALLSLCTALLAADHVRV